MEIILLEKVLNVGNLGDIANVRDGYARNYLIPQGKAKRATPAAKAEFEARRAELEKIEAEKLAQATAIAEKLQGITLKLTQKAGVDGRLFGSVGNSDIAEELQRQDFDIKRQQIRMNDGLIKTTGDSKVTVHLHTDVNVEIGVAVYGETA